MNLLKLVSGILQEQGIEFVVIGASALAIHGVSRSTIDIDLMTIDPLALKSTLWTGLDAHGITTEIRHGDGDDPLRGVVRFECPNQRPIDLIVGHGGWQARIFERPEMAVIEGFELPIVGKVDLILLKLFAGGPQDQWDISRLLSTDGSDSLRRTIEQKLLDLPPALRSVWSRVVD